MTDGARIAAFAVAVVVAFATAALVGSAVGSSSPTTATEGDASAAHGDAAGATAEEHGSPGTATAEPHAAAIDSTHPGLEVADDGYRLVLDRNRFKRGDPTAQFDFQILDGSGRPERDFEIDHEREMHFIVVRRDLTGFQHLHPTMGIDGTWSANVDFSGGGVYRVFADFTHNGVKRTLGADVHVGGSYRPQLLAPARTVAAAGAGLTVTLGTGEAAAGESRLEFTVRRNGEVVDDELQPYLGAKGHLVALREGDLAYLHTHPEGDGLAFATQYPSRGAYRLFVQFRYRDEVRTAAFTQLVPR